MFHAILYFGLTLATIVMAPKHQSCANQNSMQDGLSGAMIQSVVNAFVTTLALRLCASLFSAPGPALRYSPAMLVANACFFELFFFVGCELCTLKRMQDLARKHESYFRWTSFQGKFPFAVSLLDVPLSHALCTGAFPAIATVLCSGSGWLVNTALVLQLSFRQYTRYGWMYLKYRS